MSKLEQNIETLENKLNKKKTKSKEVATQKLQEITNYQGQI